MQMSCLYASDFPFKNFSNSLNVQKQYDKNVWETSNGTYLLSTRVQTTINHISICFLPQYQRQRKCFFFRQRKCFFFRARADKGIAWHTDVSSVVWTQINFCCPNVSMLCYKTNGKRHSVYYWVMVHLGGLLSTQEARVALGCRVASCDHAILTLLSCLATSRVHHLTNRFHVVVRLLSNRSQMTSKCGKNKKGAHEA